MTTNRLIQMWRKAAEDLCIEIIEPFVLVLSSGTKIKAEFLLKDFGATNGMMIIKDYDLVAQYINEVVDGGYGFSVLDEPDENEHYIKEDIVELLSDWGWSGDKSKKPRWL